MSIRRPQVAQEVKTHFISLCNKTLGYLNSSVQSIKFENAVCDLDRSKTEVRSLNTNLESHFKGPSWLQKEG